MAGNTTKVAKYDFSNMPQMLTDKLVSVEDALPKDFNRARFVQNSIALLNDDPDKFKEFSPAAIMAGLVRGSILGLDFFSKECYLVPFGGKLEFMPSYTGQVKLAKKYSQRPLKEIYARLIRQGDEFEEVIVNGEPTINFKPKFLNDGDIIGAFAVAIYKDGGLQYEVMSLKELEQVRSCSKSKTSPAWSKFPGEMYKKTVIRRLCKHIDIEFENPSQMAEYNSDMAMEDDPVKLNEIEVEAEANTIDFVPFETEDAQ